VAFRTASQSTSRPSDSCAASSLSVRGWQRCSPDDPVTRRPRTSASPRLAETAFTRLIVGLTTVGRGPTTRLPPANRCRSSRAERRPVQATAVLLGTSARQPRSAPRGGGAARSAAPVCMVRRFRACRYQVVRLWVEPRSVADPTALRPQRRSSRSSRPDHRAPLGELVSLRPTTHGRPPWPGRTRRRPAPASRSKRAGRWRSKARYGAVSDRARVGAPDSPSWPADSARAASRRRVLAPRSSSGAAARRRRFLLVEVRSEDQPLLLESISPSGRRRV